MTDHRTKVGAERRLRTRHKLLQTAFQLYAEHGVDEPVIERVIKHAVLSRGTFYNHFRSERELFMSVAAELSNNVIEAVDPKVLQHDNPAVRVACGVTLCIKLACRYPLIAAFLAKGGAQAVFAGGSAIEAITRDVNMAQQAGLFGIEQTPMAVDLILGPVLCTFATLLQHPLDHAYLRSLVTAILRSLGMSDTDAASIAAIDFGDPHPDENSLFIGL